MAYSPTRICYQILHMDFWIITICCLQFSSTFSLLLRCLEENFSQFSPQFACLPFWSSIPDNPRCPDYVRTSPSTPHTKQLISTRDRWKAAGWSFGGNHILFHWRKKSEMGQVESRESVKSCLFSTNSHQAEKARIGHCGVYRVGRV